MEKSSITTNLTPLNISNIQTLYKELCDKVTLITLTNNTASHALCEIIDSVKELKEYKITEHQIGSFAYNQQASIKNKLFNVTNPPYNGPHYISVLLEIISQYNERLTKNEFTSPTKDQWLFHQDNQKKLTAIKNASTYGLYFTKELATERKTFTCLSKTVAIQEFESLIEHIYKMRCTKPDEITTMATILYGDNDTKK